MERRSRRAARALAWCAGCASAAALAAGDVRAAGCDAARVTFPPAGAVLAGRVGVFGSAEIDGFQFYKVEVARATAPEAWTATSDVVRAPARHARLDLWATTALADGRYRLKLTVVDETAQERCRVLVDDLVVANGRSASAAGVSADAVGAAQAWPTAVRRTALQATAPLSDTAGVPGADGADGAAAAEPVGATASLSDAASVAATAAVTASDALSGTAATTSTNPTSGSDGAAAEGAAPSDDPATSTGSASMAARFGRAFALGFAAVAGVLALLARRARGRIRTRTATRAGGR